MDKKTIIACVYTASITLALSCIFMQLAIHKAQADFIHNQQNRYAEISSQDKPPETEDDAIERAAAEAEKKAREQERVFEQIDYEWVRGDAEAYK